MQLKPIIRYYGGKVRLAQKIISHIPEHKIYNEPFIGGGAVYWLKENAEMSFINDASGAVVNFYKVLKQPDKAKALITLISITPNSEAEFQKVGQIMRKPEPYTDIIWAWAFFVGQGLSFGSKGYTSGFAFSRSARETKCWQNLKDRLKNNVQDYIKKIENTLIFNRDALDIITRADSIDTVHYIDPPYITSNCTAYTGKYTEADFERLLQQLEHIKGKFLLSMYPHDLITQYADKNNNWNVIEIQRTGIAVTHKTQKQKIELLIKNF